MARSTGKEGLVLVYKYGVPSWVTLPDHALEQHQLHLDLRRNFVRSDREFDEAREAAWEAHPQVAEAKAALTAATDAVFELEVTAKKERSLDQTTVPRKETAAALKAARDTRTKAKAALKEVKKTALEALKPVLKGLDEQQKLADARLRKEMVDRGLFWSTGNAALEDHKLARKMVLRARREGKPAQRRMPRWDGPSTLSTQIMWHPGMPKRTPALLASGEGPWRNVVQLQLWPEDVPWPAEWEKHRGTRPLSRLLLRISGSKKPPLVIPVIMHRELPEDADISDVQLTRRMVANKMQLSVALTVRIPAPPLRTEGETVAVKTGWAGVGEGWVRVATVATATGPFTDPVPDDVKDLVREYDTTLELIASVEWRKLLQRSSDIRSIRDENLDIIKKEVCAVLAEDEALAKHLADQLERERLDIARWRSPGRMVRLQRVWPREHPMWDKIEAWRKRDMHLWQFEANERQQTIARRRDAYRKLAAWICGPNTKTVLLSGVNIAEVRPAPSVGREDTYEERGARINIQWAAPGDFREAVRNAAIRRGIEVIEVVTERETKETVDA